MNDGPTPPLRIAEGDSNHAMFGIVVLVCLSVAVAIGSIMASGLKFVNAADFFAPLGKILAVLILINLYQFVRMPGNKRFIFFINMTIIKLIMSTAMVTLQYSMAMFKAYPITNLIQNFDRSLGFNWLQFSIIINKIPYVSDFVGFCYKNWMWEFVIVFIVLSSLSKFDALYDLTYSYIIAGIGCLLVTGFIDVKSLESVAAYSIAGIHYPTGVSPAYLDKVEHLRQGVDCFMDFKFILGLVAFPSFHAGAAVLLATATRNLKWLWFPFLCFNVVVLIGTITEGGHNFADVIGGCLFAVAAIAVAQRLRRSGIASHMAEAAHRAAGWFGVGAAGTAQSPYPPYPRG
jgi:membrane-associated phospholipid phosphatase